MKGKGGNMGDDKELLRVSEAAELFDVTPSSIYSWIERGKLPHYKLVGTIRLKRSELQEWFNARKKG